MGDQTYTRQEFGEAAGLFAQPVMPREFYWGVATSAYQIEGAVKRRWARCLDLGHLRTHAR
jgi:hypothetical protein